MLLDLVENQIGVQEKQSFEFNDGDRLRAAILCLQRGAAVDDVASNLNWKDFEGLTSEILDEAGFATIRNFIMKNPRREIDVIGIKMGVAMLIDCKHWKRTPVSALTDAAFTARLLDFRKTLKHAGLCMGTIGTLSQNIMLSSCKVTITGDATAPLVHATYCFVRSFCLNAASVRAETGVLFQCLQSISHGHAHLYSDNVNLSAGIFHNEIAYCGKTCLI